MSKRNNSQRFGEVPSPPKQTSQTQMSNLGFTMPTTFVELPSKGLFYPEDHPLHMKETVEIKYMSAKEEDILSSKTLIRKNLVIDRLIDSLLVDKGITASSLLVGDRSAIVLEARRVAYGSDYEVSFNCESCGSKIKHKFNLDFVLPKEVDYEDTEDFQLTPDGLIQVTLPVSGMAVCVRMLTGKDEKQVLDEANKKKSSLEDHAITRTLKMIITSVNGVTDYFLINQFVDSMPARDSRYLRKIYEYVKPSVDMTQEYACEECGNVADLEVPLGVQFFWPE